MPSSVTAGQMQRNDREVSYQRGFPVVMLSDYLIFSPKLFGECPCALDQRFSFGVPMLQDLFQMKRQKRRFVVIFRVAAPNIFPRPHAVRFKFVCTDCLDLRTVLPIRLHMRLLFFLIFLIVRIIKPK